jgi:phage shock protein C
MHCNRNRRKRLPRQTVHRSRTDKVFFGVCGGLGEHFNISSNWVRVGFILGSVFTSGVVPIVYLICIFAMPCANQESEVTFEETSRFRTPGDAFTHLESQFDTIEEKIRRLEDHVTSREYVLKRKFESL